jgi:hypothetical protein
VHDLRKRLTQLIRGRPRIRGEKSLRACAVPACADEGDLMVSVNQGVDEIAHDSFNSAVSRRRNVEVRRGDHCHV